MRLATIVLDGRQTVGVVRGDLVVPLLDPPNDLASVRAIAAGGPAALDRVAALADAGERSAARPLRSVTFAAAVPDPGAIFAVGLNYAPAEVPDHARPDPARPERPLVYAKLPSSVAGHDAQLSWDRSVTANVDAEVELGVVIGRQASNVPPERAIDHVFGYTCIDDISSRDPWLDGDQWLLGKSMPGFCPVGPWVVTADELDPSNLRLGCTINGIPIQDGCTDRLRFSIAEVISYLSRHVVLRPGDLIATGTPARLAAPLGPERHLEPGDTAVVWIEGIGELATRIAQGGGVAG